MLPPESVRRLPLASRVEVRIESLAAGGDGVARVDGYVMFVPQGVPGDRVLVEVVEIRAKHVRARIVEVREPSASRREARCRHFGRCGGCAWQHVSLATQRAAKGEIVRSAIAHITGVGLPGPIDVIGSDEYGYRSRASLRTTVRDGVQRVGFQRALSHDVEAIDECPVLVPALQEELRELNAHPERVSPGSSYVHLAAGDAGGTASSAPARGGLVTGRAPTVTQTVRGMVFEFDAVGFFQGNRTLLEELVLRAVAGANGRTAFDLYCGAGLFTLPLARSFERVFGVEADGRAVELARGNARANGVDNVRFQVGDLRSLEALDALPGTVDLILVDPPRSGMGGSLARAIGRRSAREIRYVSCDPATFARDAKEFIAEGYRFASVVALDLFPQTPHVEVVGRFVRGSD